MGLEVNRVPFTLVEQTLGASPIFGSPLTDTVVPPVNWHWAADLSGLPKYNWQVMFASLILTASGPADYYAFYPPPGGNINIIPRVYAVDGVQGGPYAIPLTTSVAVAPEYYLDGPWRLSTDDNLSQGVATYFLTEALATGDEDGPNFEWREDGWMANIDLPGKTSGVEVLGPGGPAYYTRPVASVDYWFSARGWWTDTVAHPQQLQAEWTVQDQTLIVIGCTPAQSTIAAGPQAAGIVAIENILGSGH